MQLTDPGQQSGARYLAIGLLVLVALAPFSSGLYFSSTKVWVTALILVSGTLAWFLGGGATKRLPLPDTVCLTVLAASYAIPIAFSFGIHDAIQGFLWVMASCVIYWLAHVASKTGWFLKALLNTWVLMSVILSLLGLLVAGRVFHLEEYVIDWSIASSFNYPNALAAYLMGAILLTIAQSTVAPRLTSIAYAFALYISSVTFMTTGSRLAWLMFPLVLLGYLISARSEFLGTLGSVVVSAVGFFVGWRLSVFVGWDQVPSSFWLWLVGGAVIALAWHSVYRALIERMSARARSWSLAAVGSLFVLAGFWAMLSGRLTSLFTSFASLVDFSDPSHLGRLGVLKDAVKLIVQSPLGRGGGAWAHQYPLVQSYGYVINDPHSHIALILLEAGVLGLMAFIGIWLLFVSRRHRLVQTSAGSGKLLNSAVLWGVLSLGLHASLDVDFAFGAIWFLVIAILGASATESQPVPRLAFSGALKTWFRRGTAVVMIFAALISISFALGDSSRRQAEATTNLAEVYRLLKRAATQTPFHAPTIMELGKLELSLGLQAGSPDLIEIGLSRQMTATRYLPNNMDLKADLAESLIKVNALEASAELADLLITLDPWGIEAYERTALLRYQLADAYESEGQSGNADEQLRLIMELPDLIKRQRALAPPSIPEWQNIPESSEVLDHFLDLARAKINND